MWLPVWQEDVEPEVAFCINHLLQRLLQLYCALISAGKHSQYTYNSCIHVHVDVQYIYMVKHTAKHQHNTMQYCMNANHHLVELDSSCCWVEPVITHSLTWYRALGSRCMPLYNTSVRRGLAWAPIMFWEKISGFRSRQCNKMTRKNE